MQQQDLQTIANVINGIGSALDATVEAAGTLRQLRQALEQAFGNLAREHAQLEQAAAARKAAREEAKKAKK